ARFYHKLMRDSGLVQSDEPFTRLLTQGMVVAETYYRQLTDGSLQWFNPTEVERELGDRGQVISARLRSDGKPVEIGGIEKMSKSKNNGIDPQTMIDRFGADTVRLYTMFTSPPDQSLEWSDEGVEGAHRFLRRLWGLAWNRREEIAAAGNAAVDYEDAQKSDRREIHAALKQACFDYDRQQFNTVVSACMKVVNTLYKLGDSTADRALLREGFGIVLQLLAPIAPHIAHALWRELAYGEEILKSGWPQPDDEALKLASIQYVVQVNGKVRAKIQIAADAQKSAIEQAAQADENVRKFIGNAKVRKVILVPGKLVNIVAQ
ncbi:MAG: class I tRNA ligase family protein, partial [Gammaproteobacteria bacterium]|nr:class I tRNA ligase family protein [Gammaproteobacteria bacterium]